MAPYPHRLKLNRSSIDVRPSPRDNFPRDQQYTPLKLPRLRRRANSEVRRVTVCIAALASKGSLIICLADKALSQADVVWDSDSNKIIPLGNSGAVALTAGSDRYIIRLLRKIQGFEKYDDVEATSQFVETKFQECVAEMQDIEILLPACLTRKQYVSAISRVKVNNHINSISEKLYRFEQEFDCELIICGFEQKISPYIISVKPPGLVINHTNNGLHAIGSGAERAMSRLLFTDHKRTDGVAHSLFDCFDAKVSAEMNLGVGYEWDASFIRGNGAQTLLDKAKPLLNRVWAQRNKSPFKKDKDPDELDDPPEDWEMQLRQIVAESLGSAFDEHGVLRTYSRK